ncbi:unnamed protein product [Nesidiocoris tenuis]|uniref:Uncharacterized protein n=1 Tax=Nesidiocoris tenuis TaxID=355587 RepID=A0A6H5HJU1_9HEMI|nr:unnamed protein product [Nesidiocoris tenuis]CAB0017784.1 unnamed protein product [Nesidiocoris tenuis]
METAVIISSSSMDNYKNLRLAQNTRAPCREKLALLEGGRARPGQLRLSGAKATPGTACFRAEKNSDGASNAHKSVQDSSAGERTAAGKSTDGPPAAARRTAVPFSEDPLPPPVAYAPTTASSIISATE